MRHGSMLAAARRGAAGGQLVLSTVDVGLTSASAMILTVIAARSLSVYEFGSLGIFLIMVGVLQTVVQGGFIDVLLQRTSHNTASGYWAVERWSVTWLALALFGAVTAMLSQRLERVGLAATAVGVGLLIVRHWWVRAFFLTQRRPLHSVLFSFIAFATAMAWLVGSTVSRSFDWRLVSVSYATTYAFAGAMSYIAGRHLLQHLDPT